MDRTRVLVCGATGFIGRNMAVALAEDSAYEVVGVYHRREPFEHPGLSWVQADLTQTEDVDRVVAGSDVLIQAAATTSGAGDVIRRPYIHVADNAVMNSHILRASFDHGLRHLICFSCTLMYSNSCVPLKETDFDANTALDPRYHGAGWTKIYLEKMCEFYAGISETKFTVLRHSNVYGPHDKYDLEKSHVFGATVTKAMTATDGRLAVWGKGEEARDLIYVDDLTTAVTAALERQKPQFGLYNIGAGKAVTVNDLVERIVALSGRELRIEHDLSKPTIPTSLCIDTSKATEELGWRPEVDLDEGIARTLDWYRNVLMPRHGDTEHES